MPTKCTRQVYADNTTLWIRDHIADTSVAPGVCPAIGTGLTGIVKDNQTLYDGSATLGSLAGPGDATTTEAASVNTNGTLTFVRLSTSSFDPAGRPVTTSDALSRSTTITYTPDLTGNPAIMAGPLTQVKTTNPANQSTTVVLDPGRGSTTSTTDVAGHTTTIGYDPLGRVTAVYKPGNSLASMTYAYQWQVSGPLAITTKTLVDYGTGTDYTTSVNLYDSLGQLREVQSDAEGGGRQVSDTFYDSHGWVVKSNNTYYTTGAPSTSAILQPADNQVPDQSRTTFDGMGRATGTSEYSNGSVTWSTSTVYGGDRTTVLPPAGGTAITTVDDAAGRTSELDQYTQPPTVSGTTVSGGAPQVTKYGYDILGEPTTVTDPGGDVWTTGYDMQGHKTSQVSPDAGTTRTSYDNGGQITSTVDGNGVTLAYTYDVLGRKTGEYLNSTSGTKLATWVYDTLQAGQLTSAIRWVGTNAYVVAATGYDGRGRPTGSKTIVPSVETGLAGTYTTSYTYTSTDQITSIAPAKVGGLPLETVNYTYDTLGKPLTATGYAFTVNGTAYTSYGEVAQYSLGSSNSQAWLSFGYDYQTRRINDVNLSAQTAGTQLDDTSYGYDPVGNIIKTSDVQGSAGSATDTQCYAYDALRQLTGAWTATDNCATQPSQGSTSMIGGPNPYWTTWTFDSIGDRQSQTQHSLAGGSDSVATYSYPAAGSNAVQPHTLTSVNIAGPGAASTGYQYDSAGNTTARTGVAGGDQTLNWDSEERLASVTTSVGTGSYLYDANGSQMILRDPDQSTLYLPGEELVYNKTTQAKTGTRYYSFNGRTLGEQTDLAAPTYLETDLHGTATVAVDSSTFAVTRRSLTAYGSPRGVGAGTWPDSHTFLDKPSDQFSGLIDVGAREYDPVTGRFISMDPVFQPGDPQTIGGYGYAANDPVNVSDPTGLMLAGDNGGDSDASSTSQPSGNGVWGPDGPPDTTSMDPLSQYSANGRDIYTDENSIPHVVRTPTGPFTAKEQQEIDAMDYLNQSLKEAGEAYDATTGTGSTFFWQDDTNALAPKARRVIYEVKTQEQYDEMTNFSRIIPMFISGLKIPVAADPERPWREGATARVELTVSRFRETTEVPTSGGLPS